MMIQDTPCYISDNGRRWWILEAELIEKIIEDKLSINYLFFMSPILRNGKIDNCTQRMWIGSWSNGIICT